MPIVSNDKALLDLSYIYQVLSQTYWANDRSIAQVQESINNSLCFGMYLDGKQMGFARVLTDQVIFSYLMDVFIDEAFRGKEYGKQLITEIYAHPSLKNVKKHYLITKDAQPFYAKFGFKIFDNPDRMMIKRRTKS